LCASLDQEYGEILTNEPPAQQLAAAMTTLNDLEESRRKRMAEYAEAKRALDAEASAG